MQLVEKELQPTTSVVGEPLKAAEQPKSNGKVSMGSIGHVAWDEANDRWKGLLCTCHADAASVSTVLTEILDACNGGSRVTVRLFSTRDADIDDISSVQVPWGNSKLMPEAIIPLNKGEIGSLIYFGANRPERISPTGTKRQELDLLAKVREKPPTVHCPPEGCKVEVLRAPSPRDIEDLCAVYRASFSRYITEFNDISLRGMVSDNLAVVVREPSGSIVAISQAEIARLQIPRIVTEVGSGYWRLIEISETACLPEWRGNGFTQLCKERLLREVNRPSTIVYTESRANHAAVLRANVNLGMKVAGRLESHCAMESLASDIPQEGRMANLFVFYFPM